MDYGLPILAFLLGFFAGCCLCLVAWIRRGPGIGAGRVAESPLEVVDGQPLTERIWPRGKVEKGTSSSSGPVLDEVSVNALAENLMNDAKESGLSLSRNEARAEAIVMARRAQAL